MKEYIDMISNYPWTFACAYIGLYWIIELTADKIAEIVQAWRKPAK